MAPLDVDDAFISDFVHSSSFPIGVIDLASFAIMDLSEKAAALLDHEVDDLIGADLLVLTDQAGSAVDAAGRLGRGGIERDEAHRRFPHRDGTMMTVELWLRDLAHLGHGDRSLVLLTSPGEPGEPGDPGASAEARRDPPASGADADGAPRRARLVAEVAELVRYSSREPDRAMTRARVLELEAGVARIRDEAEALDVTLHDTHEARCVASADLARLTERQREVVSRLLDGERVPTIARSIFLSQSTVRNHLAAAYHRLGVHSQEQLIIRLRDAGHVVAR